MGLHLIMPMGGGGTRFGDEGFSVPKPLIELQGKPFFFWAAQSVLKFVDVADIIFVVLQEHIDRFKINKKILEFYPEARIQVIPHILNGAVLTCSEGIKLVEDNEPILFNDCDHSFICKEFYEYCNNSFSEHIDGALLTFKSNSSSYSYVRFDENRNVVGTVEKVVASDEAICGAYYFRNKGIFQNAVEIYLKKCAYKEYFISGVYNELVVLGKNLGTFRVDEHISFGTPKEYAEAKKDVRLRMLL